MVSLGPIADLAHRSALLYHSSPMGTTPVTPVAVIGRCAGSPADRIAGSAVGSVAAGR